MFGEQVTKADPEDTEPGEQQAKKKKGNHQIFQHTVHSGGTGQILIFRVPRLSDNHVSLETSASEYRQSPCLSTAPACEVHLEQGFCITLDLRNPKDNSREDMKSLARNGC